MNVEALADGTLKIAHGGGSIVIPQHYVSSLVGALNRAGCSGLMERHLAQHREYAWNSATDLPPPDPEMVVAAAE